MIRRVSKSRSISRLNDYQVLKGVSEKTMQLFGAPVSATYEARLLIDDDRRKLPLGVGALYAIHQRSENRILQIFENRKQVVAITPVRRGQRAFPLANAA